MHQFERARLLVRVAGILRGDQYESERVNLLEWADELLAGKPVNVAEVAVKSGIAVSTIAFPIKIYRIYKHKRYDATLLDGYRVQLGGEVFSSPSAASVKVSGNSENGWRTWKYTDPSSGNEYIIDNLRKLLS